jgi:hypothetical protein
MPGKINQTAWSTALESRKHVAAETNIQIPVTTMRKGPK